MKNKIYITVLLILIPILCALIFIGVFNYCDKISTCETVMVETHIPKVDKDYDSSRNLNEFIKLTVTLDKKISDLNYKLEKDKGNSEIIRVIYEKSSKLNDESKNLIADVSDFYDTDIRVIKTNSNEYKKYQDLLNRYERLVFLYNEYR